MSEPVAENMHEPAIDPHTGERIYVRKVHPATAFDVIGDCKDPAEIQRRLIEWMQSGRKYEAEGTGAVHLKDDAEEAESKAQAAAADAMRREMDPGFLRAERDWLLVELAALRAKWKDEHANQDAAYQRGRSDAIDAIKAALLVAEDRGEVSRRATSAVLRMLRLMPSGEAK